MKTIIKIILFALMLVLIGCNDNLKVQGFNNANHGNVIYVAKTGNNATAQLGNPDRPFSDPWAAVAAVPDSGWLVQFLDAGTYTFGHTGSGADFESPTTQNLEFNLAKNGVKMDMNHAVLKYTEADTVSLLLGTIFYVDSFERFELANANLDLSLLDTLEQGFTVSTAVRTIRTAHGSASIFDFDRVTCPTAIDDWYNFFRGGGVVGSSWENIVPTLRINIDVLEGNSIPTFQCYGIRDAVFTIGIADVVVLVLQNELDSVSADARTTFNIGLLKGGLESVTYGGIMSVNLGVIEQRRTIFSAGNDYYLTGIVANAYTYAGKRASYTLNVGSYNMNISGNLGYYPTGDSLSTGSILRSNVNSGSEVVANFARAEYKGSSGTPSVRKEGAGNLVIGGKIIANKSMLFTGGKVDISGLTFITTDTTSTRATSATTVLCNGFRSNKAMSSVNTTKIGTEFINASVF